MRWPDKIQNRTKLYAVVVNWSRKDQNLQIETIIAN